MLLTKRGSCESDLRDICLDRVTVKDSQEANKETLKIALREFIMKNRSDVGRFLYDALSVVSSSTEGVNSLVKKLVKEYLDLLDTDDSETIVNDWFIKNIEDILMICYDYADDNFRYFQYKYIEI